MWVKAEDGTFYNLTNATEVKAELDPEASPEAGWMVVAYFRDRPNAPQSTCLASHLAKPIAERELQMIMSKLPCYHLTQRAKSG